MPRKLKPEAVEQNTSTPVSVNNYVLHPENSKLAIGKISPLPGKRFRGVFFTKPIPLESLAKQEPTFRTDTVFIRATRRDVRWAMTHQFNSSLTGDEA
jgi:hypothetical protein